MRRLLALGVCMLAAGCGTTRWSDTARTATEQMLVSDAVDRAVSGIDFSLLAERDVYLDAAYLEKTVDEKYVISTLRQHILASGCILKEKKEDAEFIVEARAATVGTDRHDLLYGVPATNLPGFGSTLVATQIPEIALARRTDQQGVARLAVFAYHRESGRPVWQSGADAVASKARDLWLFGAGPFQRGTIYEGTQFAGDNLRVPLVGDKVTENSNPIAVTRESVFTSPQYFARKEKPAPPADLKVAMQPSTAAPKPQPTPPSTPAAQPQAAPPSEPLWEPADLDKW